MVRWKDNDKETEAGKQQKADGAVLPIMMPDATGIDIGAAEIYVAVPADRDDESVRCFPTFTQDLYALAAWLQQCRIKTVDGIHGGCEVFLVNARHVKNVPGRRTDGSDCQWLRFLQFRGLAPTLVPARARNLCDSFAAAASGELGTAGGHSRAAHAEGTGPDEPAKCIMCSPTSPERRGSRFWMRSYRKSAILTS